jgi:hypothetical protein
MFLMCAHTVCTDTEPEHIMGRPSTLPTFTTVKAAQRAILTDPAIGTMGRTKSGSEYTHLLSIMHTADPRCVVCDLPTLHTRWDGPATATLGLLIPGAVIREAHADTLADLFDGTVPPESALRLGILPGNAAVFCRACVDAATAYGLATGEPVVWGAGLAGLDRVLTAWPALRKGAGRPSVPTGDEFRAIARAASGHAPAAARARAGQGLPF